MSQDPQRIADLVEIEQLCARYLAYASQFVPDQWLKVFTPDVEYSAFGTKYSARAHDGAADRGSAGPVHRQHARGRVRWRPRHRDAALHLHRPEDPRHAPRLVYATSTCARPTAGASGDAPPRSCASTAASTPVGSTTRSRPPRKGPTPTDREGRGFLRAPARRPRLCPFRSIRKVKIRAVGC